MDAMKMLADFCAAAPAPARAWLAGERAKVAAAIDAASEPPPQRGTRFWRPTTLRTKVACVATVAAASVLTVALVVQSGPGGTPARSAAYVISQTELALRTAVGELAAQNSVVHIHTSDGPEVGEGLFIGGPLRGNGQLIVKRTDSWYYGTASASPARYQGFTNAGQPVFDSGIGQTPTTVVNYQARIWWRYVLHLAPWTPPHGSALSCHSVGGFGGGEVEPAYWPADLAKLLACGKFTTSGTERVDGVDAIKVTQVRPHGSDTVLWVDPSTYLPIRISTTGQEMPGRPYRLMETDDIQWLPPTNANRAKLTVPIPPGFVQVPAPPRNDCLGSPSPGKCLAPWNAWYAKYVAPRL